MEFAVGVVTVFVRDFERSLEFYDVVLGLPLASRHEAQRRAGFATGGAGLEIAEVSEASGRFAAGRDTGIVLLVPDLAAAVPALLERGVSFVEPPSPNESGLLQAVLEDPDGNRISLRQHRGRADQDGATV